MSWWKFCGWASYCWMSWWLILVLVTRRILYFLYNHYSIHEMHLPTTWNFLVLSMHIFGGILGVPLRYIIMSNSSFWLPLSGALTRMLKNSTVVWISGLDIFMSNSALSKTLLPVLACFLLIMIPLYWVLKMIFWYIWRCFWAAFMLDEVFHHLFKIGDHSGIEFSW